MRSIARRERHPVAVVAGAHVGDVGVVDRDRAPVERVRGIVRSEHVELLVRRVLVEPERPGRFESAQVRADRGPVPRLFAIRVGHHPPRIVTDHRRVEVVGCRQVEQRGREQHRTVVGGQPGSGEVDEPLCRAGDHDRCLRRRGLDQRGRIEVPGGDDRERLGDVGVSERPFVEQRDHRVVADGRAGEVGFPERCGEVGPQRPGACEQVPLVFQVVAHHDRVHAEPCGDHGERLGFEPSLGDAALERVQQVGGGRTTLQHDIAGQIGALDDARQYGVDGAAPAVVREVGRRDLPHPATARRVAGGIEPLGEFGLVGRQLLVAQQRRRQRVRREPREHLHHDEPDHGGRGDQTTTSPRRSRTLGGVRRDPCSHPLRTGRRAERQGEHDQRRRPRRRAQRKARGGVGGEPLEQCAVRRRRAERSGADGHGEPDEQQHRRRDPTGEPGEEAEQRNAGEGEAERHQCRVVEVGDRRFDPGVEPVAAVEEPVAQPAHDLRRGAGAGNGLVGLGVPQDRDAVGALDPQRNDPPHRHRRAQRADLGGRARPRRRPALARTRRRRSAR